MSDKTIRFSPIDSWFFRETRPMDASGESQSIFPPGIRTVSGAIRTWIGEQQQVNWQDFKTNESHPLRDLIGSSADGELGALEFKGVWITYQGKRLYPAPLHLMVKEQQLYTLQLAEKGITCDLGKNICLPELPTKAASGSKPLENTWIDEETFQAILNGEHIHFDKNHFHTADSLFKQEPRTGIARNNAVRTAKEGMLYQTQHVRPKPNIQLEIDVGGLQNIDCSDKALVRFGGESRAAYLQVNKKSNTLPVINVDNIDLSDVMGIIIYLLSPLQMHHEQYKDHPLPGFTLKEKTDSPSYWLGKIESINLKIHGAIVGKSVRDGGWDMAKNQPRDDRSLIPAGSLFFCEVEKDNIADAMNKLHDKQLGELQQYGYGHMAVGIWKKG